MFASELLQEARNISPIQAALCRVHNTIVAFFPNTHQQESHGRARRRQCQREPRGTSSTGIPRHCRVSVISITFFFFFIFFVLRTPCTPYTLHRWYHAEKQRRGQTKRVSSPLHNSSLGEAGQSHRRLLINLCQ
ncbi:hypothetical protein VTO42DRAFT_2445 [Malbranchea cinnamomea]